MTALAEPGGRGRWDSLDGLRGVAALLVVTFHCAQVTDGFAARANPLAAAAWLDPWAWFKFTPLRLFVSAGPPAVVVFFLLSGFVLSLPFLRRGGSAGAAWAGYAVFVVKRVCRIYLPFAAAVLVSAALYAWIAPAPIPALSAWFNGALWDRPLSADYIGRNLLLTGIPSDMTLDTVMWSLVHEMRISLLFPALFVMARRWPAAALTGSVALGVLCTAALAGGAADGLATSLIDTGRFVWLFVAGIVMAAHAADIMRAVRRRPLPVAAALWVLSLGLLLSPGPNVYAYYDFTWGLGAALLLALTIGTITGDRALSTRPALWLGRVSYSLYLIHVPLLIATVHLLHGVLPLGAIMPMVIATSLGSAEVMHRWVEIPSIRLGRAIARAMAQPASGARGPVLSAAAGKR